MIKMKEHVGYTWVRGKTNFAELFFISKPLRHRFYKLTIRRGKGWQEILREERNLETLNLNILLRYGINPKICPYS